ncbi:MAG: exo-alpha-sialidase, partial [Opitutales bacterium]|nr:exo-alpha-sialidase [Opitutales bacterium]
PVELVDGSENEEQDYACWNPVVFQPADGPLMLFYKVGLNPRDWGGALITSNDGSHPEILAPYRQRNAIRAI